MAFPRSTYRLQIRDSFDFHTAAGLCEYLAELGVTTLYLSPVLQSTVGSQHGYDCTDPTRLDESRGGEEGWRQLTTAAAKAGLSIVFDMVPNHMGISEPRENPAWWDVLTHGRGSRYADWFDIDFDAGPIKIPVLDGTDALADLRFNEANDELTYFDDSAPIQPGTWSPGDSPQETHERQAYRFIDWRRGNIDLNYRRFFAVSTLAAVRVELPGVFQATHELAGQLAQKPVVGVRVDHPDGLVDPREYFERLRELLGPEAWLIAEKILEPGEELPDWQVQGTTGYDAMSEVCAVFCDPNAEQQLSDYYVEVTGDQGDFHAHVLNGKRQAAQELFPAEMNRILRLYPTVGTTTDELAKQALGELAAQFPVYRSYLPEGLEHLEAAFSAARKARPDLTAAFDFWAEALFEPGPVQVRFQQLTGAVMAKGVEDTAFYRYSRFLAGNEVGGDPSRVGLPPKEFHALQQHRLERWPATMTSLSTHDTKRGEDVRARLAVLSEMPTAWRDFVAVCLRHWHISNLRFAYLLAQTLAGVGPIERSRLHDYARKAMREAAEETTYAAPNAAYEDSVHAAINAAFDEPELRAAWRRLTEAIEIPGRSNSLAQKLVQLTAPGVPDVYQGTEIFEDSLVDPDNRRDVDFDVLRGLLRQGRPSVSLADDAVGAIKLWVTSIALKLRRDHPELFTNYTPLQAQGPATEHVLAFDRGGAITVATRLPLSLPGWQGTHLPLPAGDYLDALTGRTFANSAALTDLFEQYPVALLIIQKT